MTERVFKPGDIVYIKDSEKWAKANPAASLTYGLNNHNNEFSVLGEDGCCGHNIIYRLRGKQAPRIVRVFGRRLDFCWHKKIEELL